MIKNVASDFILKGYDIRIINTLKNSGAQGLLVKNASQLANDGVDINNIVKSIEETIPLTKIYVAVDNPSYLARSGRVSQRAGKIVKLMNLKPIMTLDSNGFGKAYGGSFSFEGSIKRILKQVGLDHKKYGIVSYSIVHGADINRANDLAKQVERILGFKEEYIAQISPIVGAVAGEGAVAISYILRRTTYE
jgi:DegV family protein with EDD domain